MDARTFFNKVTLMLANKKAYERLESKAQRTEEEDRLMGKYLDNYKDFEMVIYEECVRVNDLIKKGVVK